MDFYSVDKIVGSIAVLELPDRSLAEFPLRKLPEGLREGDLLIKTKEGFFIDESATKERRRKLFDLQNSLFDNEDV